MLCDFVFLIQFSEIQIEKSLVMIFSPVLLFFTSADIFCCACILPLMRETVFHTDTEL